MTPERLPLAGDSFQRVLSRFAANEWIRNRSRNRLFAVLWGALATVTSVVLIVFLVRAIRNDQLTGVFVILGVFGSLVMYAGWYAYGSARAGVMVTQREVVIRNPFSSRVIPLSDVAEFAHGLQRTQGLEGLFNTGRNPTPGILVKTNQGRSYPVWTLAREGLVWNSAANEVSWAGVAESLNHLVDSLR